MCNKTVRGLDSLEVEKKAFCAEVMSSNVDDLFSPLDLNKAEAESTVPEPKLTHGVAGVAFESEKLTQILQEEVRARTSQTRSG